MRSTSLGVLALTLVSLGAGFAACSSSDPATPTDAGTTPSGTTTPTTTTPTNSTTTTTEPPKDAAPATQAVSLSFEARSGKDPFSCAKPLTELGTAKTTVEPLDFRVYVSDVKLLTKDGKAVPVTLTQDGKWQYKEVALLDFEDKSGTCKNGTTDTNTKIVGSAPTGTYDGVSFTLGVPFALNHQDPSLAPSPLNVTALSWAWQYGMKFARVDVQIPADPTDPTSKPVPFFLHLGSTECDGSEAGGVTKCDKPNRGSIELRGFDPTTKKILVDYAALVQASDLSKNTGTPGCMSEADDPECPVLFPRLGVDATTGQPDSKAQTFFRVE